MEPLRVKLDDLMSFNDEEERKSSANSRVSWLSVLSSEFEEPPRGSDNDLGNDLSKPDFSLPDITGANYGYQGQASDNRHGVDYGASSRPGASLEPMTVFGLFAQKSDSQSKRRISDPGSSVEPQPCQPSLSQHSLSQYDMSETLSVAKAFGFEGTNPFVSMETTNSMGEPRASNVPPPVPPKTRKYFDRQQNKETDPKKEVYTSTLQVILSKSEEAEQFRENEGLKRTDSMSSTDSFHPYGSISLRRNLSNRSLASPGPQCESSHTTPLKKIDTTDREPESANFEKWNDFTDLQVALPDLDKEEKEFFGHAISQTKSIPQPTKKSETHRYSIHDSSAKSLPRRPRIEDSKPEMFLGGGLFEVAKERDAEVIAFGEMLSEVRSNFHWYESSNRGYVLSPALPSRFGKTICNRETEVVVVIFTEGRRDTFRFAIDTWASVKEVLELTLSCLSNSDVNIEHASTTHVLKICGRSEYLEAQRKLVEYEYIQECLKFQKEVQFVLLENEKVSRHLARTASDDEIDLVPRSYKDFFNLSHTTAVSQYGLTVLVESFTEETSRLLQEATSLVNPKFEPSPIIQLTKAICSTLASIETADIHVAVDALNLFHEVNKNSAVLNVTILKNLLSNLTDSVFLLIEMYCDAFDTEFASSQISRPGLSGTLDVSSMTDKLKVHISSAHRIPLYWKQDFENFSVDGGVYYGGCLLCPIETTTQSKLTRKFSELLQWGDWLKFDIPVKRLPRESRLCLTLYGTKPSSKGNPSARSALGWVALQLFNFNGVLLTGTQILGLWPDSKANPVGSCTSNLLHPNSVLLLVTFERYLSEIVFPDCSDFPGFDDMDHCIPEADYGLFEEILMKDLFNELKPNERSILWEHRFYCRSVPRALPLVLSSAPSWEIQSLPEIYKLLHTWSPMSPVDAMELLKVNFPDRHVRSMAVRWMANFSDDELCDYLPQLVQALKYEIYHDSALTRFLVRRALGNVRLMHLLFWFLKDKISEPQFGQRFQVILGGLLNICGEAQKEEFTFQDDLVTELIKVARKVKSAKDSARNNILQQELAALAGKLCCVFRLPITPSLEVVGMDVRSCGYFTSNSAPLRLVFRNVDPFGENVNVIFKMGDDMRQDTLTMQLVGIMNKIWLQEGLDLKIITYQCMATGPGMGMIEIVSDSQDMKQCRILNNRDISVKFVTLREIHTEFGLTGSFKDESINRWLLKFNPDEKEYRRAVENFTASCAGYCVATYVLGICDRHNDNIMIHRSGHLFHIDFSKILGHAQMFGNFKRDRAPFVLTPDMAYVINGGYRPSPRFQHFIDLCSRAFNLIRRHSNLFLNLLSLMLNSGIGSLGNVSDLRYIRDSLLPQESEAEATAAFTRLIESSLSSWFTQVNFFIHNVAQIRDVSQLKRTSSGNASISLLSFALKTYTLEMDGFIESARVVDYQKRYNTEKYYIYVINICRANSDQATFVFRRFGHFIELHAKLSELYPDIALPRLPARIYLGRSQIRTVAERRRAELDTFLRHLLMMPQEISESDVLYTFLHPIPEDEAETGKFSVRLLPEEQRERAITGQIKLSIRHERGALRVMVMHAKDLSSRNSSTAGDPYVKLYLLPDPSKTTKLKTKIAKKSQNPTYNETLVYSNLSAADLKTRHLQVTVWDHDRVGENDFMGGVVINLADMDSSINITNWYPLKDIRS